MSKLSTKCTCNNHQTITCKNCSAVKMKMYFKTTPGYPASQVWYSHLSKNRKNLQVIAKGMERRALNHYPIGMIKKILFFDNQNVGLDSFKQYPN